MVGWVRSGRGGVVRLADWVHAQVGGLVRGRLVVCAGWLVRSGLVRYRGSLIAVALKVVQELLC